MRIIFDSRKFFAAGCILLICGSAAVYGSSSPADKAESLEISWEPLDYEERGPADEWVTVDINKAGTDELTKLPGIGDAKALAVVSYREKYGEFKTVEEIMNVPGIKQGVFDKIREHIYVNGG